MPKKAQSKEVDPITAHHQAMGAKGGKIRASRLTPEQHMEWSKRAVQRRNELRLERMKTEITAEEEKD